MQHKIGVPGEIKQVTEEGDFEGYASVFGVVDAGDDVVERGAFSRSLSERKPKMLWQHDSDEPIGVWRQFKEDDYGLYVKGRIMQSLQKGREVLEMLRAGVVDGLSIGYQTVKSLRDELTGVRTLLDVELFEVSVVTFPMNRQATVGAVKGNMTKRDVEQILRDAGMPNALAVNILAGGWDAANAANGDGMSGVLSLIRRATTLMGERR